MADTKGLFSVGNNRKVMFSKANLCYERNTGVWRFMDDQYSLSESQGQSISTDYSGSQFVTLFGWATSGNSNVTCRYPYNTSSTSNAYGPSIRNQDFDYNLYDWGYNRIKNGGGEYGEWRTLSHDEWDYLLFDRANASAKKGWGVVGGVAGRIILPDAFVDPRTNGGSGSFVATSTAGNNTYSSANWDAMESAGAVFLPAAGYRSGTRLYNVGSAAWYWTSTAIDQGTAWYYILSGNPSENYMPRNYGMSVRLVTDD